MGLAKDLSDLPRPAATKADGWAPDPEPRFVHLLAEKWQADNEAAGPKARAHKDARFRHSDAGACARSVALSALDTPPSDPMDLTGVHNTSLGTIIHEAWQEVLAERYPDALIEPKVQTCDGAGAGHIDAVVTIPEGGEWIEVPDTDADPGGRGDFLDKVIEVELKTVGGFAYKMAVGERGAPQGPKHEHRVQSALNAKAVDADEAVIAYLSKEAISVNAAKRKNLSELARFCAEWTMTRDEYLPLAEAEEARVLGILRLLDEGTLPARKIPSPELPTGAVIVDPSTGRWEVKGDAGIEDTGTFWACGYCRFQTLCTDMPSGRCSVDEIPVELRGAA